jgi:branched-chain amino acid transport system permease protein
MMIVETVIYGLVVGAVYGVVALGFVLIYKSSSVLNLAQGSLLMLGGFICLQISQWLPGGVWFFILAVFLTLLVATLLGFAVERLALRPLIGEPLISIIMMTIGLNVLLGGIGYAIWGSGNFPYPADIIPIGSVSILGTPISYKYIFSLVTALLCVFFFTLFFQFTRSGIAMRATADDQLAAQSLGISTSQIFRNAWAIGCITAAIGGIIIGFLIGLNSYNTPVLGLKVLPVVLLGGLDSIPGAIIGGLIIGVTENLAGAYLDPIVGGGMRDLFPYILIMIILMVKPYGLFGWVRIERI